MKRIVLYGAGGFAREVVEIIEDINRISPSYEIVGYVSEGDDYSAGQMINDYPWLGGEEWLLEHKDSVVCCVAIGTAKAKAEIQKRIRESGVLIETIIAPGVKIGKNTRIGAGCIITYNSIVSVNCVLGDGALLNGNVTIGHDSQIGNYTTIMTSSDIGGWCQIGNAVNIGAHVYVVPRIKIGSESTVASGSIVFANVKEKTTVLGNPARRMKALED